MILALMILLATIVYSFIGGMSGHWLWMHNDKRNYHYTWDDSFCTVAGAIFWPIGLPMLVGVLLARWLCSSQQREHERQMNKIEQQEKRVEEQEKRLNDLKEREVVLDTKIKQLIDDEHRFCWSEQVDAYLDQ